MRTILNSAAALLVSFGLLAAPAAAAAKKPKAPTVKVVKRVLAERHADGSVFGQTWRLQYSAKVKIAKGRKSRPSVDLVRPGTTVFPVKTRFVVQSRQDDGSWKPISAVDPAKFLFYKDEFGDWVFTNQDVEVTPLS
jgi:hypothetical protein